MRDITDENNNREKFTEKNPEIVAWVEAYSGNFDFYRSLQSQLASRGYLSEAQVKSVRKALSRDAERAEKAAKSQHLGNQGSRLQGEVTCTAKFEIDTHYGPSTIYVFEDESGSQLKWFTASNPGIDKGDKGLLEGTVKKHDEYRGTKQTILTRCKFKAASPAGEADSSVSHFLSNEEEERLQREAA
jgi:hypothetical protein